MKIQSHFHRLTTYIEGLDHQQSCVDQVERGEEQGFILGFEHPRTITFGVRGDPARDLIKSQRELELDNFCLHQVRRGGEATLHNPGQLVIYPLLHLPTLGLKLREYLDVLQRTTILVGERFQLSSAPLEGEPGLFTPKGKWAYFGLQIQKGVSTHGLAINVSNNLEDFRHIRACGVARAPQDKIENYTANVRIDYVFDCWVESFQSVLRAARSLTPRPTHDLTSSSSVGI